MISRDPLLHGLLAGAVGTAALNIVTYLDMTIRARPNSQVPAKLAQTMTRALGIQLAAHHDDAQHRSEGLGALLGYLVGLGLGVSYGAGRTAVPGLPLPLSAAVLATAAMVASDVPASAFGVTAPRTWSPSSWASDVLPHLAYGIATALAFEAFSSAGRGDEIPGAPRSS